jgi:hypothetical protein
MEGQEKREVSLAELYHAVVRAVGALLPPGRSASAPRSAWKEGAWRER